MYVKPNHYRKLHQGTYLLYFTYLMSQTFLRLTRVARWRIFKPKIPIWVNFGGSFNGIRWFILGPKINQLGLF
jgi:hypothetical protein